jgi:hypothetical protein
MTPDTRVVYKKTRPELTIDIIRSASRNCYHETWLEVISRRPLDAEDLARLDACGLLGMGQAYDLESSETITDSVPPVVVDKQGQVVACVAVPHSPACAATPRHWQGEPITNTADYTYHRYVVRRICDSGD